MQPYPTPNRFINALINSYYQDLQINQNKKNKYLVFSPFKIRSTFLYSFALSMFGILTIFLFPFFPIFRKLRRLSVEDNKSKSLIVISSEKSRKEYNRLNISSDRTAISLIDSSTCGNFGFKQYANYLDACFCFFKTFNRRLWFYPAILHLPKMIVFEDTLKKLAPDEIIFTNHYDRWTYIILHFCDSNQKKSVLIQHGIEDETSPYPKFMYSQLSKLLCYNEEQYKQFVGNVFKCITEIEYFKPSVELSKINHSFSLLVVGHGDPIVVLEEIKVIKELMKIKDLMIFVKPHPVFRLTANYDVACANVEIIHDKDYYPDVDLLLHSGSTLAEEYRNGSSKVKIFKLSDYNEILK